MSLTAQPLASTESDSDLRLFHELSMLATDGRSVANLLSVLGNYLGQTIRFYAPGEVFQGERLVVAPLYRYEHHLGDLVVDLSPDLDSAAFAGRLLFFAPLVVLAISYQNTGTPQANREESDRLEAVLEAANEAILMVDCQGTVVMATVPLDTLTGISPYGLLGRPLDHLVRIIEERPELPTIMANMLRSLGNNFTEILGGEFEVNTSPPRVLVWYSLPIYARSGNLLGRIFALRDATHERELDRMKAQFIMLISHELRTPLTSVKGFSDLILEGEVDSLTPEVREYLDIISFNADRLIDLINDILDVTRIKTDRVELNPAPCSMQEVIEQVCAHLQFALDERGHKLITDIQPSLPPCWADQTRMIQVVTNLISNAIKYTLEPGEIRVGARYIEGNEDLPAGAAHGEIVPCVLVTVQDNGIGIAAEDRDHVFQQFYRVSSEAANLIGGTGLGLTIVKAFVEMHGGHIWFESEPGVGTTFFFTIPVVEGKSLLVS